MVNFLSRAPIYLLIMVLIFFNFNMVLTVCWGRHVSSHHYIEINSREDHTFIGHQEYPHSKERVAMEEVSTEIYPTGSSLPDCTHACGPCYPCKRVMISFKCSIAESCPIVYRCTCKGKYYHVPSN